MKIIQCEQGSEEWHREPFGVPTASHFHELITPVDGKPSAQARKYVAWKCAEWWLGGPPDSASSPWMDRGNKQEDEGRRWYAFENSVDTQQVGFVTNDAGTVGCSPDTLVGDDGGLEIKTLTAVNHVLALLGDEKFARGHYPQVQGCLWVCERQWWDVMAWNPAMTPCVVRVERDEEYIAKLAAAVEAFLVQLDATMIRLKLREPHDG